MEVRQDFNCLCSFQQPSLAIALQLLFLLETLFVPIKNAVTSFKALRDP